MIILWNNEHEKKPCQWQVGVVILDVAILLVKESGQKHVICFTDNVEVGDILPVYLCFWDTVRSETACTR